MTFIKDWLWCSLVAGVIWAALIYFGYDPQAQVLLGFGWIGLIVIPYLLPAIIAGARRHNDTVAITVLTLLFGWTFIGWGIALIWALRNNVRAAATSNALSARL